MRRQGCGRGGDEENKGVEERRGGKKEHKGLEEEGMRRTRVRSTRF